MEKQQSNPTAAAVDYVVERASRTVVVPLSISYEVNHNRKGVDSIFTVLDSLSIVCAENYKIGPLLRRVRHHPQT